MIKKIPYVLVIVFLILFGVYMMAFSFITLPNAPYDLMKVAVMLNFIAGVFLFISGLRVLRDCIKSWRKSK